jgi:hypothetical protein
VRKLIGREKSAEGRKSKGLLSVRESPKDDFYAIKTVVMAVPGGGAGTEGAQKGKRVALRVEFASSVGSLGGMKQITVLGYH